MSRSSGDGARADRQLGKHDEALVNDRFLASHHRVTAATDKDRYSLAFFFNPDLDDIIVPMESCCTEDHPSKYEPLRYGDFFADYLAGAYSNQKPSAKAAE